MVTDRSRLSRILGELRRRHVYRVMGAYAITAWFTVQIADVVLPALFVPYWVNSMLTVLAIVGLPITAVLAWMYDITPQGVVRTPPLSPSANGTATFHWNWRWLDYLIIAGLLAILTYVLAGNPDRPAPPRPERSIAVLPFNDLSPDQDTGYFSDGMAEAIIDSLSRIPELQVTSRTSSFSFRNTGQHISEVAAALGVGTVLEGSVRKSGDRFRISARLVDGKRGVNLWNETYAGTLDDVFSAQDNISRAIADVLKIRLLGDQTLVEIATRDQEAYDEYLRGRSELRGEATLESIEQAINHFRQALERDRRFNLARAGLCTALWQKYEATRDSNLVERAIATCEQAELEDPTRAETFIAMGHFYRGTGQPDLAAPSYRRALEIEPGNSEAHIGLGRLLQNLGDLDEAERHLRRAIELDPAYWRNYSYLGGLYFTRGDYELAAAQFTRAIRLEPAAPRSYANLGGALYHMGDFERAAEAYLESIERQPTSQAYSNTGIIYYYKLEYDNAEDMFAKAVAMSPSDSRFRGFLADSIRMQPDREQEAREHYREAIRLAFDRLEVNPQDHYDRALLALYMARVDEHDEARAQLQKLADAGRVGMYTHRIIGDVNFALGNEAAALEHYEAAVVSGLPPALLLNDPGLEKLLAEASFLPEEHVNASQQ